MGFSSAPDPAQLQQQTLATGSQEAKIQSGYNEAAQRGSMVNESNPYGTIDYNQIGVGPNGVPIYGETTTPSGLAAPAWANMFAGKTLAGGTANALLRGADYGNRDPTSTIGNMTSGL